MVSWGRAIRAREHNLMILELGVRAAYFWAWENLTQPRGYSHVWSSCLGILDEGMRYVRAGRAPEPQRQLSQGRRVPRGVEAHQDPEAGEVQRNALGETGR